VKSAPGFTLHTPAGERGYDKAPPRPLGTCPVESWVATTFDSSLGYVELEPCGVPIGWTEAYDLVSRLE